MSLGGEQRAAARVSVLVRSMDRPSLPRALNSALGQTYPSLQVIVLAAAGGRLAMLERVDQAAQGGRIRAIDPGRPLDRAAAANALLAAAGSELLLFLDDDDWLLPEHVQRLVDALEPHPEAVAAYAGVRCVSGDPEAPTTVHLFDDDVRPVDMQLQNRLPIHAVLFRRAALQSAVPLRFDEQLGQFEDWDFWLQLMARGPFVRVPGESAVYWLDAASGSGHADEGSERRRRMLYRFGERQLARWTPDDVVALIQDNSEKTRLHNQRQQQLAAELSETRSRAEASLAQAHALLAQAQDALGLARSHVQALQAESASQRQEIVALRREGDLLAALRLEHLAAIERLHQQVAGLLGSTSWRVTKPLRLAGSAWCWLRGGRLQVLLGNGGLALRMALRRRGWLGFLRQWPRYLAQMRRHLGELSRPAAVPGANPFAGVAGATVPLRLHPEISGAESVIEAKVSVVIPTFNGGDELVWLLRKLQGQQAVRAVEIVVVDSGSTDGSAERARALGAVVVEITQAEFSHSHARNLGAERATGDHLLFMVQDAYPVGELWLYGLLRFLIDHRDEGVVAASCAEYCRSDSDVMYDSMVHTHYRFLGCLEADRIGRHTGDDHMALRSMGQLSDVACLIPRELFLRHRYRGDYAEDLDLGIRLIRAGHRIAMLASVKVIHSHNRPAWYYLKRSFVDVIFLVGLFDDFHCPPCASVHGLLAGVAAVANRVGDWLREQAPRLQTEAPGQVLADWIVTARQWTVPAWPVAIAGGLGDARVESFLHELVGGAGGLPPGDARTATVQARDFVDAFMARIDHFSQYASAVYGVGDPRLHLEVADAVRKTFAATVGAALAYLYLDRRQAPEQDAERLWIEALFTHLKAGV
ncbi:glycosyltransferase [Aquabacterium sp.]|uniref:glycosyltransferase n=1 Tax=Aquabacterium sp. TaxID=1872578 RepID=UPI0037844612